MKPDLIAAAGGARVIRAVIWCVALAAIGYVGLSLWAGWREVVAAVVQIGPWVLLGLLGLSLVNYLLRFFRWGRYLALLGTPVPWRINLDIYFAGFALTTSPGKLGETLRSVLLKPHGVPAAESLAVFAPATGPDEFTRRNQQTLRLATDARRTLSTHYADLKNMPSEPFTGIVCLPPASTHGTIG